MQGKPSLTLTITSQTAEVARATASSGHPALASLAAAQAAGLPAALRVTLTPGWFADAGNSGQTRFEFGGENAPRTHMQLAAADLPAYSL